MWFENLPAIELARRLREIALFRFASVDELFRMAGIGRQVRHESGRVLFEEGAVAEEALLLLEGRVALEARNGSRREVSPPALVGFQEVLEGASHPETARAVGGTLSLSLGASDLRMLLADNIELAQGLLRMLFRERHPEGGPPLVLKGVVTTLPKEALSTARLTPIERGLVLQEIPLFERATAEELQKLASIVEPVILAADAVLFNENDPPSLTVVLAGELTVSEGDGAPPLVAGPGDVVGLYQVLAGVPAGRRARVARPGSALRLGGEELQNLLADDVELLQAVFGAVFRPDRASHRSS